MCALPPLSRLLLPPHHPPPASAQFCRLVREAFVELDLPYTLASVAKGSPRRAQLAALAGRSTAPYLVDPNRDVSMFESADIVDYLYRHYTQR